MGVPWKNRAMEFKRKYEEMNRDLPGMIREAVTGAIPQVQPYQERQPTIEELEQLAMERPDLRPGIEAQKAKIQQDGVAKLIREEIKKDRDNREVESQMKDSFVDVRQRYPEMFTPDGGWNMNSPLTQEMSRLYNSFPQFKQSGWGLSGAADMAFGRLARSNQPKVVKAVKQQQQKIKDLEKRNLPEGGGKVITKEGRATLLGRLKQEGLKKGDLTEYYKAAGFVPTE